MEKIKPIHLFCCSFENKVSVIRPQANQRNYKSLIPGMKEELPPWLLPKRMQNYDALHASKFSNLDTMEN